MISIRKNSGAGLQRNIAALLLSTWLVAGAGAALAAEAKQKTFATPEQAAKELIAAVKARDEKAVLAILGNDAKPIINSGDKVVDREGRDRLVKSYDEANKIEKIGDVMVLSVGKDAWPFPIPIVKAGDSWRFDTRAGKEEILNRRIGRNELAVIQVVQAYVDAQREYYLGNPQKDKMLQYAQKFTSAQGRKDGLYYPVKAGEPRSPLGPLVVNAREEGYRKGKDGKPIAYHGYYYRILKGQGAEAKGGAYNYVVRGRMIGGHALVAWPASYGNSGVMTFIVNHDGVVFEKDLGPETAEAVKKISRFNPDKTWKRAEGG